MTLLQPAPPSLDPGTAAGNLASLGFLASSDLPDRLGPAYLLVALREAPTFHHFDPEAIGYWISAGGRGVRRTFTRETHVPIDEEYSWGIIRIVDRLNVTNEYLTFGGRLQADCVDGVVVAVFTSAAPILRRGGHSQGWDDGAESLGAFFSRLLLAVDYVPGFEARAADADPVTRYAAFLADAMARYRSSPLLRAEHAELWTLLQAEDRRLREQQPTAWAAGMELRDEVTVATGRSTIS
jgi:hypothetical protein